MNYPAGKLTVRGQDFEIFTDDQGRWVAYIDSSPILADSRDKLRDALMKATKQAATKVAVPFIRVTTRQGREVRIDHGTATGIHSANGNVLARFGERGSEQLTHGWGNVTYLREGTDMDRWRELSDAARAANAAFSAFVAEHKIELSQAVQAELNKVMGEDS